MSSTASDPVVIASYARTPMGGFQGVFAPVKATDLGAAAVRAAVERAGVQPADVEQIVMGCVLPAGLGQAPARQAAIGGGLPTSVEATTVNKMCGSGMQAAILAHDALAAGSVDVIVAGGMESMTNAPFLSKSHRGGARIGHDTMYDHMYLDGLEDAYEPGRLMGSFAEESAKHYQFTREAMDEYAISSLNRAKAATASGAFKKEIVPVEVVTRKGAVLVEDDEQPAKADPAKIPTLKPAFAKDGGITAANASSISDGAAALVVMSDTKAKALGLTPLATIRAYASAGVDPSIMGMGPWPAVEKALAKAGLRKEEIDLWELNEAFAAQSLGVLRELKLPKNRVNINGGAIALGHPIGASGARVLVTLLHAMADRGVPLGVASLCIGGGQGIAMVVERA